MGWFGSRLAPGYVAIIDAATIEKFGSLENGCLRGERRADGRCVFCFFVTHSLELNCEFSGPLIEAGLGESGLWEMGAKTDASRLVGSGEAVQFWDVSIGDWAFDSQKKFDADLLDRLCEQW